MQTETPQSDPQFHLVDNNYMVLLTFDINLKFDMNLHKEQMEEIGDYFDKFLLNVFLSRVRIGQLVVARAVQIIQYDPPVMIP